jgi:nucleotide-binding universal stress UspA family protein
VVHVVEHPTGGGHTDRGPVVDVLLRHAGVSLPDARFHDASGDPRRAIQSLADRLAADVIVLGPHRHAAAGGRVVGSTALALVTGCAAPCLVAGSVLRLPLERVVVPVDQSETARGALVVALSWGSALRRASADDGETSLAVVHVRRPGGSEGAPPNPHAVDQELRRIRGDAGNWAGVSIDAVVIHGDDVPRAIASFAEQRRADLVVAGTRGDGLDSVARLGSVSAELLRLLTTPLLLVPPAIWAVHATSE